MIQLGSWTSVADHMVETASAGEHPAIALTLYPQVALYTVLHSDIGERC